MKFYSLEPEVAGGLGPRTIMNCGTHPPIVTRLHYVLDGWLGDELLEGFPVFIATEQLRKVLRDSRLTGIEFEKVDINTSEEFRELEPDCVLPNFLWLKIVGRPGVDDFGLSNDYRLVVSHCALELLNLKHCAVADYLRV